MQDPESAHATPGRTDKAVQVTFTHTKEKLCASSRTDSGGTTTSSRITGRAAGPTPWPWPSGCRDRNYEVFLDRAEFAMGDDWKGVGERAIREHATPRPHRDTRGGHGLPPCRASRSTYLRAGASRSFPSSSRATRRGADVTRSTAWIGRSTSRLLSSRIRNSTSRTITANLSRGPSDAVIQQLADTHRVMRRRNVRAPAMGLVATHPDRVQRLFDRILGQSLPRPSRCGRLPRQREEGEASRTKEREHAEQRARVATSRQLSASANTEVDKRLDRALILAAQADRFDSNYEFALCPSPEPLAPAPRSEASFIMIKIWTGSDALPSARTERSWRKEGITAG